MQFPCLILSSGEKTLLHTIHFASNLSHLLTWVSYSLVLILQEENLPYKVWANLPYKVWALSDWLYSISCYTLNNRFFLNLLVLYTSVRRVDDVNSSLDFRLGSECTEPCGAEYLRTNLTRFIPPVSMMHCAQCYWHLWTQMPSLQLSSLASQSFSFQVDSCVF